MKQLPQKDPTKNNTEQGAYEKFIVSRVDGSDKPGGKHFGCTYFVLDMDHDPGALAAISAYAAAIKDTHPILSQDLIDKYGALDLKKRTCPTCEGKGGFYDTTYDRTGSWENCGLCGGTGLVYDRSAISKMLQLKEMKS